jgi:hypothetical protein
MRATPPRAQSCRVAVVATVFALAVGCGDSDLPDGATPTPRGESQSTPTLAPPTTERAPTAEPAATTEPASEPAYPLLAAEDLGTDFEDEPFSPDHGTACTLGELPEASTHSTAAAVSQDRQQFVFQELLTYDTIAEAADAFASTLAAASCPGEGSYDETGGAPRRTAVVGADQGFTVGFVDENGAFAYLVVQVERHLAVVAVKLHQGVGTLEVLPADTVVALLVERLR